MKKSLPVFATLCAFLPFVLLTLLLVGVLVSTASAASIGGSLNDDYPKLNSSVYSNGDQISGSFTLSLDPREVNLENAYWSFYRNYWDSSKWQAICSMGGYRDQTEVWPQSLSWSQSKNSGKVDVSSSLSFSVNQYSPTADPVMYIDGGFSLSPVAVTNSSFSYYDYDQEYWYWDKETGTSTTKIRPAWRAEYQLYGSFVADTPELARAMGMQFAASPVPEPSTLWLLCIGTMTLAIWAWRKKR